MAKTETASLYARVAEQTSVDIATVTQVVAGLEEVVRGALERDGTFVWPGMLKLTLVRRPATKDRVGVNPFTKEQMVLKGHPATTKVRATAQGLAARLGGAEEEEAGEEERYDPIEE
jgi:DNA-binding protein HU-beta